MKPLLPCILLAASGLGGPSPAPAAEEGSRRPIASVLAVENDKFFAGTDHHYTQGLRITVLYNRVARNKVEETAQAALETVTKATLGSAKLAKTSQEEGKIAYSFGQDIFTPSDTDTAALAAADRPYAGWLYSSVGYHTIEGNRCWIAEVTAGMVGPSALGEPIQNGWHKLLDIAPAQGWAHQLHNEPGLNLAYERRWRFNDGTELWDAIPRVGVVLGTVNTHLSVGGALRLGLKLPRDFGHDLIRAGGGYVAPTAGRFYAFVGGEVRAVAHNAFLDGNMWRDSHSVRKRPVTGDLNVGLSLNWPGFRLLYTQNYRLREFYGQGRRDVFGSISVALLH